MRYMLLPEKAGTPILFDRPLLVIGRHPQCDVRFESRRVSRFHCCLANLGERGILVRDLGSTNGTFVNGHRVREARLRPGDRLRIAGEVEYRIEQAASPAEDDDVLSMPRSSQLDLSDSPVDSSSSAPLPLPDSDQDVQLEFDSDEKLDAHLSEGADEEGQG